MSTPEEAPLRRLDPRSTSQGVAVWALLGMLLGGVGPGVAAIFLGGGAFAIFVVASELTGLLLGVVAGLLDVPRRLIGPLRRKLALSCVIGLPLGVVWSGLTGAAGGASLSLVMMLSSPMGGFGGGSSLDEALGMAAFFGGLGAVMAVIVGTLPVILFSALRAWTLHSGRPWWLAHLGAVVLTGILSIPGFLLVLGGFG